MNYATTPKQDYLSSNPEIAKTHHALAEDPNLRKAMDAALAEMQYRSSNGTNPKDFNECAASHLRMLGARDFVSIFLNLCETETLQPRTDTTNLPGNVKQMPQQNRRN